MSWIKRIRYTDRVIIIKDSVAITAAVISLVVLIRTCSKVKDTNESENTKPEIIEKIPTVENTDNNILRKEMNINQADTSKIKTIANSK